MYVNANNILYFDSFGFEHILREIKKIIGNKNIIKTIYRIQAYDFIMCGYCCIGLIYFMLEDKNLFIFS